MLLPGKPGRISFLGKTCLQKQMQDAIKDSPLLKEATLLADCPDHSQRALKQQNIILYMEIYHYIHIIQDMYLSIYRAFEYLLRMNW